MVWHGKALWIDLSEERTWVEDIPSYVLENLIGGKGLGVYFLLKYMDPKVDPLSPDNLIVIATGPAQSSLPVSGRFCMVTKSPHTGIFLDSHVGGFIGPELKFAGYDAVIIKGKAKNPLYLKILDSEVTFHSSDKLVGKNIEETTDILIDEIDPKVRIAAIGPAAENGVKYAVVNCDYYRTAARGGAGLLFASKKLKAIAVKASNRKIKHTEEVKSLRTDINKRARDSALKGHQLPKFGTSWLVDIANARDQLPTLNYQRGQWDRHENINGVALHEAYKEKLKRKPCYNCTLACAYVIDSGYSWANRPIQHPEYESLGLLGSNLGIDDLESLLRLNHMCNILGMDTISTGSSISWFMECSKRGKVPQEYMSEIVHFGEVDKVIELVEKIAYCKGVGQILAKGVKRASKVFGMGTDAWAVHVRGLELPAWDPRGKLGLGLSYVTSHVGGSHLRGWPNTPDFPDRSVLPFIDSLIEEQDLKIIKDSLITCHFMHSIDPPLKLEDCAKIFETLTGIPSSVQHIRELAQNIWILCREFNIRVWGVDNPRVSDTLVPRLLRNSLPSGPAEGLTAFVSDEDHEQSLDDFYPKRNCSTKGIPIRSELDELLEKLKIT
jgi:aldehyde:ferredoxin oxidoreductase